MLKQKIGQISLQAEESWSKIQAQKRVKMYSTNAVRWRIQQEMPFFHGMCHGSLKLTSTDFFLSCQSNAPSKLPKQPPFVITFFSCLCFFSLKFPCKKFPSHFILFLIIRLFCLLYSNLTSPLTSEILSKYFIDRAIYSFHFFCILNSLIFLSKH